MSTEYYFEPEMKYEDFIKSKSVDILEPPRVVYQVEHRLVHKNGNYCYAFNLDGDVRLERFGGNSIWMIFPDIIEEHGVRIFDEFGLEYPECND